MLAGCPVLLVLLVRAQDGAGGGAEHGLRNATVHEAIQAAAAVGGHGDQLGAGGAGALNNFFDSVALGVPVLDSGAA